MPESESPKVERRRQYLCISNPNRKSPLIRIPILLCTIASGISAIALAQAAPQDSGIVLQVDTREVILNVLALDSHDHPVLDLTPGDLEVSEDAGHKQKIARDITSLRLVDPNAPSENPQGAGTGFMGVNAISCRDRTTPHYVLSYRPSDEGWSSGYHKVVVTARRHGLKLFYEHSYYVGQKEPLPEADKISIKQINKELAQSTCGSLSLSPSVSLRAELLSIGPSHSLRYSLNIDPDSLAFVSLTGGGRRLQLDYGACNFDARGYMINFLRSTTDQVLTMLDYEHAKERGLRTLFEFEAPEKLAMTRFVVRDRVTGNLGLVSVTPPASTDAPYTELEQDLPLKERLKPSFAEQDQGTVPLPPPGRWGSFGSIVPKPNAFCGDVYSPVATTLDFRELDPSGLVFANFLQVPDQLSPNGCMIPGLSCDPAFGVDYRGAFWVRTPGEYAFSLTSDDGSRLEIDDKLLVANDGQHAPITREGRIVLDAGRHTIHIPYYENGEGSLMLELWVHPPGGQWKLFDMRDFAPPSSTAETKSK